MQQQYVIYATHRSMLPFARYIGLCRRADTPAWPVHVAATSVTSAFTVTPFREAFVLFADAYAYENMMLVFSLFTLPPPRYTPPNIRDVRFRLSSSPRQIRRNFTAAAHAASTPAHATPPRFASRSRRRSLPREDE